MVQKSVNAEVNIVTSTFDVTAGPGSAGTSPGITDKTVSVRITRKRLGGPVEYKAGTAQWAWLDEEQAASIPMDLSKDTLLLRKASPVAAAVQVLIERSIFQNFVLDGMSVPVEASAGVGTITGTSGIGNVLNFVVGEGWTYSSIQWKRQAPNGGAIVNATGPGATTASYTQVAADVVPGTRVFATPTGLSYSASGVTAPDEQPPAPTVPGAPTIGTSTAGDGQVSVAFVTPASNGGSAILDYQVLLSTGQIATGASSPISVTAPNGTPVTATVRARNAVGYGVYSAVSNSVTPSAATVAPGAPTIGTATAGDGAVSVAFTAPASNGGSAILDYQALLSTGQTATGASTPISVPALNGTPVTATVRARNAVGYGASSAASNSVTPSAVVTAPTIQSQPAPQAGIVGGTATFTVGALGNPLNYEWQRFVSGSWSIVATTVSLTLTDLQLSDTGAQFRVRVWNSGGSVTSSAVTLTVSASVEQQKIDINGFDVIAQPPLALRQPSVLSVTLDVPAATDTAVAVYLRDDDPETDERLRYFVDDAYGTANYGGYIGPYALYDAVSNKTFNVYQCLSPSTPAMALRVAEFDHATQEWSIGNFVFNGDTSLVDDDHGTGTIAVDYQGYLHVVGGSHATSQYFASSTNPGDSTAWKARQSFTDGQYGYPHLFRVGDGLWLFQSRQVAGGRSNQLRKTTALAAGVSTWDAGFDWVSWGADSRVYITDMVQRDGKFYIMCEFRPGDASRIGDQFVYVMDVATGAVSNVEGTFTTSTFPIDLATSRTNFRIFDATDASSGASSINFDGAGRLHVVYGVGPSQLAGASAIPIFHRMWSGTEWTAAFEVGTVRSSNVPPAILPLADGGIDISWSRVPSGQNSSVGCMRKRSSAGAWDAERIFSWGGAFLSGPATWRGVLDAHPDIRIIAAEGAAARASAWGTPGLGTENSTGGATRIYAHGDSGYMGRRYVEHSAATQAFAAMTIPPSKFRQRLISEHIRALDGSAGVFNLLRAYYCHAAHDAQAARINLRPNRSYDAVNSGMTFQLARGVGGPSNTGYMDTGARGSYLGWTTATAYLSIYSLTPGPVAGAQLTYPDWTSVQLAIQNASGNLVGALGTSYNTANPIDVGHGAISRTGANITQHYADATAIGGVNNGAWGGIPSSGGVRIMGVRQIGWTAIGLGMSKNQICAQKNQEARFLAEIGAVEPRNAYKQAFHGVIPAGQTSVQLGTYTPQMAGSKRVYVENDKALACDQTALMTV